MSWEDALLPRLQEAGGPVITLLGEAEAAYRTEPDYLLTLAGLANHADSAIADSATWLIKSAIDQGGALSCEEVAELVAHLPADNAWGAQLHVCQIVSRLDLDASQTAALAQWVSPLLRHKRPFLRAWSLDALWSLAKQRPELRNQAEAALSCAMKDEAASVRARARNVK